MKRHLLLAAFVLATPAHAENLYEAKAAPSLIGDARALRVGDALTVLIVEAAAAESRADTSEDASFELTGAVQDASGLSTGGLNLGSQSNGEGRTARSGRLRGQVSVLVAGVLASGNLLVRGEQLITINGEQQKISVEGIARPVDISAENTIASTRLVNARIEYSGEGWVGRSQKNGWFRRLLVFLGF